MRNSVLFGNGINLVSDSSITWDQLLSKIKADKPFSNGKLPNTMIYERIFLEKNLVSKAGNREEFRIKEMIATEMAKQESNEIYNALIGLNFDTYLTTNYDNTFEKAIHVKPKLLSTEDLYSLRRKRAYKVKDKTITLWNIHGEIDYPKSIMLGLDHYCGSIGKMDAYIKGGYTYKEDNYTIKVPSMESKLSGKKFNNTSWIDSFFSSNIHIIGLGMDYSETDLWWVLNKRARMRTTHTIDNNIVYYDKNIDKEKVGLLESFGVKVVNEARNSMGYEDMYYGFIDRIRSNR